MKKSLLTLFALLCFTQSGTITADPQTRIVGGSEAGSAEYPFLSALMFRNLGLTINDENHPAFFMSGAPADNFTGELSDCGFGDEVCDASNKICLIERGDNFFFEKAKNCQDGGGNAAIIYNNEADDFRGTVNNDEGIVITIPVVSTSKSTGELLKTTTGTVSFDFTDEIPVQSFCGGSYIGDGWVATAAHCVVNTDEDAILVNVGGFDLDTNQTNVIGVEEIRVHDNYNPVTVNYDFALIKLTSLPLGVAAVQLASAEIVQNAINSGATATAIGRGLQQEVPVNDQPQFEPPVKTIFEVNLPMVTNQTCNTAYNATGLLTSPITPQMVCAGNNFSGKGACFGDSGGPLILFVNGQPTVTGITSWGLGCAQAGLFDVYARVSEPTFLDMVNDIISGNSQTGTPSEISIGFFPENASENVFDNSNVVPPGNGLGGGGSLNLFALLLLLLSVILRLKNIPLKTLYVGWGSTQPTK